MASGPQWKLQRLGPRAVRVLNRRKGEAKAIKQYELTLPAKVKQFVQAYQAVERYEPTRKRETAEARQAAAKLAQLMRSWLPLVTRDMPDYDGSELGESTVPDDVINAAGTLVDALSDHKDSQGRELPYKADALSELEAALAIAQKEQDEAEAADSTYQKLQADAREAAAVLDVELQRFRNSLAAAFGRQDKDYQKLRMQRAGQKDEDDEDPSSGGGAGGGSEGSGGKGSENSSAG